jgi:hypothetical protein
LSVYLSKAFAVLAPFELREMKCASSKITFLYYYFVSLIVHRGRDKVKKRRRERRGESAHCISGHVQKHTVQHAASKKWSKVHGQKISFRGVHGSGCAGRKGWIGLGCAFSKRGNESECGCEQVVQ